MTVRVRYAPSPTGHLHIGGVRTALFNYLFAKHHGGQFILRSEDTDLERNVPGAEQEILEGFRWLGFRWEEGPDVGGPHAPYRCTDRLPIYRDYLKKLADAGAAYPCYCTAEELDAQRAEALRLGQTPRYSGKCRDLTADERAALEAEGRTANWRFRVPEGVTLSLTDAVRGPVSFESDDIGDFVIMKSNGLPTYNFQVVIDDALMEITHVIRGEEHLSNTPRQLLIYRALGLAEPAFAHLPQVLDETRKKLSKRDPNVLPVHAYREAGYVPQAIVNFLALLGWSPGGEEEILSLEEIIARFDLERVNKSGAVFDVHKLRWMANQYLKQLPLPALTEMVRVQLQRQGIALPDGRDDGWLETVVGLYQEQMACAADFLPLARGFFERQAALSAEALAVLREPGAADVVRAYHTLAEASDVWTAEASRDRFNEIKKTLGVKGKALFMPVRAAVTGEVHGPDLQMTIACLPKAWVLERMEAALAQAGV
ncbi:glutamate--tRNA ligase [Alicyclobacillus cycloheptanicus]|uniref:Glutamate--tRNA ligase n=1 Tax=Alicyclobacillus cycloheptanicus TaxID=1457 RepID=A0ABT9XJK6_9BACL|nr:glutamate--tRNA ligase [Alicyclobacillus cycloheptanicus]MDQ0190382.1 nondiscriminating glutamyl-tRNA synthetase [Alicyclobacillus cycloheptanicus]WDM02625.1 glutamate--tRNA ligase [Alicyclobacillus cycloheptanicus]